MKAFYGKDCFLHTESAVRLYEKAKDYPIFDYHCHLSPKQIAEDAVFENIGVLWLGGDHYKWRLMRADGIEERLITGDASWRDKFLAFASVVPKMAGNPIYHWLHMELKAYFGIAKPLNSRTAPEIWEETLKQMSDGSFSARKLILRSNVETIFTTDDPCDDLAYHKQIKEEGFAVRVLPTFRPDILVAGLLRPDFTVSIERLGKAAGTAIRSFEDLLPAFESRLDYFAAAGCRASDLSLGSLPAENASKKEAKAAFEAVLSGKPVSSREAEGYTDYMLRHFAGLLDRRDMVMQLHLAAMRNNNTALFNLCGPDCGNDSVGEPVSVPALRRVLDEMNLAGSLPKMIVYTLNANSTYEIATMLGNFQGKSEGRLILGAAWWFCDHRDGITEQLKASASTGLLGSFTGMLTDSRSFTAYPRHDYFRRILCDIVGKWVEDGEYDPSAADDLIADVCIRNARKYFQ